MAASRFAQVRNPPGTARAGGTQRQQDLNGERNMLRGLMMNVPLLVPMALRHAATCHGDTEIVSRTVEGPIHRYTYAEAWRRAHRLANALAALGLEPGDRVGTLAWNGYRHF